MPPQTRAQCLPLLCMRGAGTGAATSGSWHVCLCFVAAHISKQSGAQLLHAPVLKCAVQTFFANGARVCTKVRLLFSRSVRRHHDDGKYNGSSCSYVHSFTCRVKEGTTPNQHTRAISVPLEKIISLTAFPTAVVRALYSVKPHFNMPSDDVTFNVLLQ